MNLNEFSYEENGRRYIKPEVSLNEQNAFIQNLRDTQGERNAQIQQQTHNLGTNVPSNIGGLTGGEAYFNARYQTPQTNSVVADLRSAAQAQALSTVMSNEIAKAKKRYQDAYRAAQNRTNGGGTPGKKGNVEFKTVGDEYELSHVGTLGDNLSEYLKKKADAYNNLNKDISEKGLPNMVDMSDPEAISDFIRNYYFTYNEGGYNSKGRNW